MSDQALSVRVAVTAFFQGLGEDPDETLAGYLISTLEVDEPDTLDLFELQDIVAGFYPSFEALSGIDQHALLSRLLQQVRHNMATWTL